MWIAKPITALNPQELAAWSRTLEDFAARGEDTPLAQTLSWGQAIEATGGHCFLVLNTAENVGGMVFAIRDPQARKMRFECINGPLLHWDDQNAIARQLATFAMAVSKLDAEFESLTLKPRWEKSQLERRLALLPVPAQGVDEAATIQVGILGDSEKQFSSLHSRLRRTFRLTEKSGVTTRWERATAGTLAPFVPEMQKFGKSHGFTVPPWNWFEALVRTSRFSEADHSSFWLAHAECAGAEARLLIAFSGKRAYYLFGNETRPDGGRSAVSPAAAAHLLGLQEAASAGIRIYDLNGFLVNAPSGHPYAGVCRFKEQFGGSIVQYKVPEFVIS